MSESTIKSYNQQANEYESRWAKYLDHTHDAFLRRIETDADDRMLDVSGGTGLLARQLIDRGYSFSHLTINDPSDKMLAIARDRFSEHPKISFANNKAEELPYDEDQFDRIFCLNSFHIYKNQKKVLDLFHHILKPGRKFYLLDWNRAGFFRVINQIIQWRSSEYIDTRSLSELKEMLHKSDFEIQSSHKWNWRYWKFLFITGYKS